jgi:hypothetical protein
MNDPISGEPVIAPQYVVVSANGYRTLPVPDVMRERRGRMFTQDDPPVEIEPTLDQFLTFLNQPVRFIRVVDGVKVNGTPDDFSYCVFKIPGLDVTEMQAMDPLLTAMNKKWYEVFIPYSKALELTAVEDSL